MENVIDSRDIMFDVSNKQLINYFKNQNGDLIYLFNKKPTLIEGIYISPETYYLGFDNNVDKIVSEINDVELILYEFKYYAKNLIDDIEFIRNLYLPSKQIINVNIYGYTFINTMKDIMGRSTFVERLYCRTILDLIKVFEQTDKANEQSLYYQSYLIVELSSELYDLHDHNEILIPTSHWQDLNNIENKQYSIDDIFKLVLNLKENIENLFNELEIIKDDHTVLRQIEINVIEILKSKILDRTN